jgi:tetratricopeptide (TPR) repeat protein
METNNAFPQVARRRVTLFLLACLGALLFTAVVYRVDNPSIVQHEEQREMPGGGSMEKMGDMAGVSALMQRLQSNPDDIEAMRSLGMSFMEMQAWERALAFWDMVLERHADDVMALNQKGFCLFELEQYAEAAVLFERMLGIEKDNFHAHYNLGVIYKYYLEQPEKAASHFQAVVDGAPEDPALLSNARRELGGE